MKYFLFIVSLCFSLVSQATPAENQAPPIVVELFTSQSCSSCPKANKVLESLSKYKNIITLSCHVTYWDHLQWKDTLSQPFCTARQRTYAQKMGASRTYTPQIIINGKYETVGSYRKKIASYLGSGLIN